MPPVSPPVLALLSSSQGRPWQGPSPTAPTFRPSQGPASSPTELLAHHAGKALHQSRASHPVPG